eukprot:jgi/Mesvir1/14018/Mv11906-RA.1
MATGTASSGELTVPSIELKKKKIRDAFLLFEHKDKKNATDEREIPTIVRYLGLNPTSEQLERILAESKTPESTSGLIDYYRFEDVMVEILMHEDKAYARDNEERLMRAFRALDPDGKGYISGEHLKDLMMTKGDPFQTEEAAEFLHMAVDEATGLVYYEDIVELLANDGKENLSSYLVRKKKKMSEWSI